MRTGWPSLAASAAENRAISRISAPQSGRRASRSGSRPSIGRIGRKDAPPDLDPLRHVGKREIHGEGQAPQKGGRNILAAAGCQDDDAGKPLDALEQEVHLDRRVAVVSILDFAALAEQRIGFVEIEQRASGLGRFEQPGKIFLRLADIAADELREIDAIEIEPRLMGQHFGGQGLAGASRAGEQDGNTAIPACTVPAGAVTFLRTLAPSHGDALEHAHHRF